MKYTTKHITGVLSATFLFLAFTLWHEYDWLIPPSPASSVASTSKVPVPDVIEEYGSEDEIEYDDFNGVIIPLLKKFNTFDMVYRDLFIPNVATPPPDIL